MASRFVMARPSLFRFARRAAIRHDGDLLGPARAEVGEEVLADLHRVLMGQPLGQLGIAALDGLDDPVMLDRQLGRQAVVEGLEVGSWAACSFDLSNRKRDCLSLIKGPRRNKGRKFSLEKLEF